MAHDFHVIVAGLGAMGSAAVYHLSRRGKKVLGLDRFHPPHELGSSHGQTRIIREAYFEHPLYVPMVQRAFQLWRELESDSGRNLLVQTGGLMIGRREGVLVAGALRSAREHQLEHRLLSAGEVREKFPALEPSADMAAVWEPRAGILFLEQAIQTHLELASSRGAAFQFDEPMVSWAMDGDGVRVFTAAGSYTADRLIISAGAWLGTLVTELNIPLAVERQVLFWFEPKSGPKNFAPANCPIHLWEQEPGKFFYGFPDLGNGVKVAVHHEGAHTQPDKIRREVSESEKEQVRQILSRFVPSANGRFISATVCMYTNTPDEHFLLDVHPRHPLVLIVSPCSGHGFKFSPVIGEIVADLATDKPVSFDLGLFRLSRFSKNATP